jgi:ubiquinone/menaquinone biosynthesis C-methylase UbiE
MTTPHDSPATDRARLVGAAYATPGPLLARAALYAYERDPFDLASWVLNRVEAEQPISATSRVLDIGCGPGRYLAEVRARYPGIATVGLDLSAGMAAATLATGAPAGVADAIQLPIRTASIDLAISAHMLYHVPDIARAATELARVVGSSGIVAIVTNGIRHLAELDELSRDAVAAIGAAPWTAPARSAARFLLENAAALIEPALDVVAFDRTSREIVVTEPAPIVAYVESEESLFAPALQHGTTWADVLCEVEARVTTIVARDGAFIVHSDVGVMLCRAR